MADPAVGGAATLDNAVLVLPKPGFFVTDGEQGHALALRLFEQVKEYSGMSGWDVDLVADHNPAAATPPWSIAMIHPEKHALGTFAIARNRVQITYTTELLKRPDRLIATFAHELAHYLLAAAPEALPCENDEVEFMTDLAAVFLGFGVFLANARFEFEGMNDGMMQGWRWQRAGYLPEADLIFALALFIRAKGLDGTAACHALKPHLGKMLRRALQDLSDDSMHMLEIKDALADESAGRPGL